MAHRPPYFVHGEIPASGGTRRLEIQVVCEPDEEEPPEESLYKATEQVQTVEHSVPHFSENRAALGALLNLVRWQHLRGMQLSSLTIR